MLDKKGVLTRVAVVTMVMLIALFGSLKPDIAKAMERDSRKQWWLYSEINTLPESIVLGQWYRLANEVNGKQLRYDRQAYGVDLVWGWIDARNRNSTMKSEGDKNIRIDRHADPKADHANLSRYLRLNEPVAIYVQGGGYLIYKGRGDIDHLNLGWQERSQFDPVSNTPDIYQWEFRDISGNIRDHRKTEIRTKQTLALFNAIAEAYFVYQNQRGIDLKWEK